MRSGRIGRALRDPGVPAGLRFMSRGFVRWPATVLAVILAGLVTYGQLTRLSAEDFGRGTSKFGKDALDQPSVSPSPAPSSSSTSGPSPTTSPGETPGPTPSVSPSPTPSGGQDEGFAWSPPARGTYTYSVSGQENVSVTGPACSRTFREGSVTVVPLGGDFQMDSEYVNSDGSVTHRERRIVEYSDAGVRVKYTEASVFCIQQRNEPADYRPPLLLYRFPLEVGSVWTSHAVSQNRTSDLTGEVLREETVTAAGRTFQTFVIKTLITFSGNQEGQRSDTWWFAPSLGMPARWQESTEARQGPATFREHATWILTGTP